MFWIILVVIAQNCGEDYYNSAVYSIINRMFPRAEQLDKTETNKMANDLRMWARTYYETRIE